ncbi:hypothetical protein OUZ56_022660 [Daphnia magna]|uniref:Uncharacterized protein n=1 Tax=Daphnia magna TaxID=35525 RepID=A0ABR0AX70_9CRUS|nr:hypothetical protein OUZ56_022660 [Daphnia magna]
MAYSISIGFVNECPGLCPLKNNINVSRKKRVNAPNLTQENRIRNNYTFSETCPNQQIPRKIVIKIYAECRIRRLNEINNRFSIIRRWCFAVGGRNPTHRWFLHVINSSKKERKNLFAFKNFHIILNNPCSSIARSTT